MAKKPISSAGLCAAISMMRVPSKAYELRKWSSKIKILTQFAALDTGDKPVEQGFSLIAELTCMHVHTVQKTIAELVADKILLCEAGTGRRANIYQIEPDVRRWRNIEWGCPISMVEQAVGFATGEYRREEPKLYSTVYSATQRRFVVRPIECYTKKPLYSTLYSAIQTEPLYVHPIECYTKRVGSNKSPSDLDNKLTPSANLSEEGVRELSKISGAFAAHIRARGIWGEPRETLAECIADGATADELAALLPQMPHDMQAKSGARWIADRYRAGDVTTPDLPDLTQARADNLRARIAAFGTLGDEEIVYELQCELDSLEANSA